MVLDVHVNDIPPRGQRHLAHPSYWGKTLLNCGMHEGGLSFANITTRSCKVVEVEMVVKLEVERDAGWWRWVTKQKQELVRER